MIYIPNHYRQPTLCLHDQTVHGNELRLFYPTQTLLMSLIAAVGTTSNVFIYDAFRNASPP